MAQDQLKTRVETARAEANQAEDFDYGEKLVTPPFCAPSISVATWLLAPLARH